MSTFCFVCLFRSGSHDIDDSTMFNEFTGDGTTSTLFSHRLRRSPPPRRMSRKSGRDSSQLTVCCVYGTDVQSIYSEASR